MSYLLMSSLHHSFLKIYITEKDLRYPTHIFTNKLQRNLGADYLIIRLKVLANSYSIQLAQYNKDHQNLKEQVFTCNLYDFYL